VLKGLSPKDNREVPPLRYDQAAQLKKDFPDAVMVLNGGLTTLADCEAVLPRFDGVMLGRSPWHDPSVLSRLSQALWPHLTLKAEEEVIEALVHYSAQQIAAKVPLRIVVRPILGLFNGRSNSRIWRRMLSDSTLLKQDDPELIRQAWQQVGGDASRRQVLTAHDDA